MTEKERYEHDAAIYTERGKALNLRQVVGQKYVRREITSDVLRESWRVIEEYAEELESRLVMTRREYIEYLMFVHDWQESS